MAILRSFSGEFYDVPDKDLDKYLVPEDKVKGKLEEANLPLPTGPAGGEGYAPPPGQAGGVVIQVHSATPPRVQYGPGPAGGAPPEPAAVSPYACYCGHRPVWHNYWHNCHYCGHGGHGHGGHGHGHPWWR